PNLPTGSYRLYADVTYETGLSDTLTTAVEVPESTSNRNPTSNSLALDPDDSWQITSDSDRGTHQCRLGAGCTMTWLAPDQFVANQPLSLRFTIQDAQGQPILPELYLGMRGHLALRRDDGSVFTHLHPGGSASMAAMQPSVLRTEGKLPLKA